MRSPIDTRFKKVQELMVTGRMVGQDRPVGRITWSKQRVDSLSSSRSGIATVRYIAKDPLEFEFGGIRTITIDRSIGQDAATCTITMYNARPDSNRPEGIDTAGTKGYLTAGRGAAIPANRSSVYAHVVDPLTPAGNKAFPTDWGYAPNGYQDVLIPNTVLRTYQGYGSDNFDQSGNPYDVSDSGYVPPQADSKLYLTGTWLIDKVTYASDGTISIECRDFAKLLIEQPIYPPMIPIDRFPLIYIPAHNAYGHKEQIGRDVAVFSSSSVDARYGANAKIHGHRGSDAFDKRPDSFWFSGGSQSSNNVEWLQAKVHGPINEIVLDTWKSGYEVFICVHEDGRWLGITDEVQKITVTGSPTGGNFRLTFKGATTANIAYNATPATVQSALVGLSTVLSGDVSVTGARGGPYRVVFKQNFRGVNVPQMTASDTLTGGHSPGVTISTVIDGSSHIIEGNGENLPWDESWGDGSGDGSGYFYVVASGDTLWDIAGTYYGDNTLWPIIARANNNIIKDPHWIYPGQKLRIPYVKGTRAWPPRNGTTSDGTGGSHVDIPYVKRVNVPSSGKLTVNLGTTYTKANYVRLVFRRLHHWRDEDFRVGVRSMVVRNHIPSTFHSSTLGKAGYIQDWTEALKELCAWAGFAWEDATPNPADPVLGHTVASGNVPALRSQIQVLQLRLARPGQSAAQRAAMTAQIAELQTKLTNALNSVKPLRVWGDFETLGAGPVVATPADYFTSKSFMDGIRQIVDFIGGVFFVDEGGGVQFRLPNIWSGGNFIDDTAALSSLGARISQHPIEFHEDANLVDYQAVISDESVRSEIMVIGGYPSVNSTGPIAGGYVLGYNSATHQTSAIDFTDILAGQYRLAILPGDSSKLFYTERECQRMAELTALFILFAYRQGSLKAPCHPALQLDDQVQIFERATYETNIHYVSAINTHQDVESGEYSMDVTTHWLGTDPNTNWFVNKAQLTPAVLELPAILARVGKEAGGDIFEQPPYGTG